MRQQHRPGYPLDLDGARGDRLRIVQHMLECEAELELAGAQTPD